MVRARGSALPAGSGFASDVAGYGRRDRAGAFTAFFVFVIFFGVHTNLSAPFLPHAFVAFVGALGVAVVNRDRFTPSVLIWFIGLLLSLTLIEFLSELFGGEGIADGIRAVLNLGYDIFIGFAAFVGLLRLGPGGIRWLFLSVLIVLLVGAALEVANVTKSASDWFRVNTLQSGIYDRDQRDIADFGMIRPKFFASEPAKLGETMSIAFVLWLSMVRRVTVPTGIVAFLLLALGLFLVRSPVIVFGAIAYGLVCCAAPSAPVGVVRRSVAKFIIIGYNILALLVPTLAYWMINNIPSTPQYFTAGSFFARIIAPYYMAVEALRNRPLFGIGLGADDALTRLAIGAYTATGRIHEVPIDAWATLGPNACSAFWFSFISIGVVGSLVLFVFVAFFLKVLKVEVKAIVVYGIVFSTFWLMFGRMNSPVAWVTLFMVVAICHMRTVGRQQLQAALGGVRSPRHVPRRRAFGMP